MRQHIPLLALVLAHLGLACAYAWITPYRTAGVLMSQRTPTGERQPVQDIGAPDERQHANYVQRLLSGRGFPVLGGTGEDAYENYQAHQPPLYYVLASGWARLTGVSDVSAKEAGIRLRLLNSVVGAGTVAGVYFFCFWGLRRREVALTASAFAALLPMNAALSGALSNDPLLFFLCTWTLALCMRALREGWTLPLAAGVGILAGLAIVTKTTGLALVPALLVAAALPQAKRPSLAAVAIVVVLVAAVPMPWLLRNQQLYGDPLALGAFNAAFVGSPKAEDFIRELGPAPYWIDWVAWWTGRSLLGAFGYMDIFLNETGLPMAAVPNTLYRLFIAFLALALIGWLLSLRREQPPEAVAAQWLAAVFLALVLVLFARFNAQYFQGQARYLLPAIGSIALIVATGLASLSGKRATLAGAALAAALLTVNLYALARLPGEFEKRMTLALAMLSCTIDMRGPGARGTV